MKIDVVVDYYRKMKEWPAVQWGLLANIVNINRIHIVNDEPWNEANLIDTTALGNKVFFHDHPHDGCGMARSIHQGVAEVVTEYFAHIDGDVALEKGSLETNLIGVEPNVVTYGTVHDIDRNITPDAFPNPPIEREDWRVKKPASASFAFTNWRDCYWIAHTDTYRDMGGHDIAYRDYGLIDYDFGIRWMLEYGLDSYRLRSGLAYHIGGVDRPEDKVGKKVSTANIETFTPRREAFLAALHAGSL